MTPREAAIYAKRSYLEPPTIGRVNSGSRALVVHELEGTVVAFRGSDDLDSWLHDLNAGTTPVHGLGHIHTGFWDAWVEMAKEVIATACDGRIIFIGHSLGAALAIIAAADYATFYHQPIEVWAFEPPKVTCDDEIGALLASVQIHLYRNGNDLVTQVPSLLRKWRHPAPLTEIGTPIHPFPNIEDHNILRVIEALS